MTDDKCLRPVTDTPQFGCQTIHRYRGKAGSLTQECLLSSSFIPYDYHPLFIFCRPLLPHFSHVTLIFNRTTERQVSAGREGSSGSNKLALRRSICSLLYHQGWYQLALSHYKQAWYKSIQESRAQGQTELHSQAYI